MPSYDTDWWSTQATIHVDVVIYLLRPDWRIQNLHYHVAPPTETGKKCTFQPSHRKTIHVVMIFISN
jgi:hypothetical protein